MIITHIKSLIANLRKGFFKHTTKKVHILTLNIKKGDYIPKFGTVNKLKYDGEIGVQGNGRRVTFVDTVRVINKEGEMLAIPTLSNYKTTVVRTYTKITETWQNTIIVSLAIVAIITAVSVFSR